MPGFICQKSGRSHTKGKIMYAVDGNESAVICSKDIFMRSCGTLIVNN